jgi:hypothetical protein
VRTGTVKEVTVSDNYGEVLLTMWGDVAMQSSTQRGKRILVKNSLCDYNSVKRRMIIKINEISSIEVCTTE